MYPDTRHQEGGTRGFTPNSWRNLMAWTTPTIVEVCVGMEINAYELAEI